MNNYVVRGGLVYDGTGALAQKADIVVQNNKIARLIQSGEQTVLPIIDATDCIVTPGFIDIHRHCDIAPFTDNGLGQAELMQGITTAIAGNCGLAPVPLNWHQHNEFYNYIEPVTGKIPQNAPCDSYAHYTQVLSCTSLAINMGYLAAMGAVRYAVKGFNSTPFSVKEQKHANMLISEAMDNGAYGLSLGIMYKPECYTKPDEYDAVVKQVAKKEGILCAHIRGEGDSLAASVKEVLDIAQRAEVRLEISHLKATGVHNWNKKIFEAIELIDKANARGQCVTADFYPYDGGSTTLLSLLPPTLLTVPPTEFATVHGRCRLRDELYKQHFNWDNMVLDIGWERIVISSVSKAENACYQGVSFRQATITAGFDDPADLMSQLIATEGGNVAIIVMSMSWKDVQTVASLPYTALISDALYGGGKPHPRLYGAFPRMLRKMVIEDKLMSMEQAIYKMTALPAQIMKLKGRGILAANAYADILVFNPNEITDRASYKSPCENAQGIRQLILNGVHTIKNGKLLNIGAGKLLKQLS